MAKFMTHLTQVCGVPQLSAQLVHKFFCMRLFRVHNKYVVLSDDTARLQ
jgi:hypothetical protein